MRACADLLDVFGYPRVCTDAMCEAGMRELQLSKSDKCANAHAAFAHSPLCVCSVSWIEFKSFLILQSEAPLAHLLSVVRKPAPGNSHPSICSVHSC